MFFGTRNCVVNVLWHTQFVKSMSDYAARLERTVRLLDDADAQALGHIGVALLASARREKEARELYELRKDQHTINKQRLVSEALFASNGPNQEGPVAASPAPLNCSVSPQLMPALHLLHLLRALHRPKS